MPVPRIYDAYDPPPSAGTDCSSDEVLTQQSFKEECDINTLVKRYGLDRAASQDAHVPPQFGDFSDPVEFLTAQDVVAKAVQQFEALPANVRERFSNRPEKLLEFVQDEANTAEAIKLGIATERPKEVPPAPQPVALFALNEKGEFVPVQSPIQLPSTPPTAES